MTAIHALPIAALGGEPHRRRDFAVLCARAISPCVLALLLVCTAALLGGCDDEVSAPQTGKEIPTDGAGSTELAETDWLTVHDVTSPAQWLASRQAGHDLALDDPKVKQIHATLQEAKRVFGTPYRMTANRAVQLEEMIDEEGWEHEDATDLIVTFSEAGESDTAAEGFGQIAQAYFQLRKTGLSRDEALQRIRDEAKRNESEKEEATEDPQQ